jgi:D-xylose transport system permease protein
MSAEVPDALAADGHKSATDASTVARFLKTTELDTRMLGMIGALAAIWIALHILSGGLFLTPRNLWNLSVQASPVAIMAAGMALVIVTRNIDLSVGSVLGFLGMIMGLVQTDLAPKLFGFESPITFVVTLAAGLALGVLIGALQGFIIAYLGVPSFIVTLGGLLVWRGGAWWVTSGQTIAPLDARFRLMGGGPEGAIGANWSWFVALLGCAAVIALLVHGRARRKAFAFPLRPMGAEFFLGGIACALIVAAVAVANAYPWPAGSVRRFAELNHIALPEGGLFIAHGIAVPVLIAIGVGIVMTFLATRTRFGRYVYAIGGNPEAAELAGVNTRWVIMKIFMLMGLLAAIAGAISIARLNAATNSEGTLAELLVIAAAVIGGLASIRQCRTLSSARCWCSRSGSTRSTGGGRARHDAKSTTDIRSSPRRRGSGACSAHGASSSEFPPSRE